jgi:hypothetical protein
MIPPHIIYAIRRKIAMSDNRAACALQPRDPRRRALAERFVMLDEYHRRAELAQKPLFLQPRINIYIVGSVRL